MPITGGSPIIAGGLLSVNIFESSEAVTGVAASGNIATSTEGVAYWVASHFTVKSVELTGK
jgi:hypothetical protein